jgi:hypothetical protein
VSGERGGTPFEFSIGTKNFVVDRGLLFLGHREACVRIDRILRIAPAALALLAAAAIGCGDETTGTSTTAATSSGTGGQGGEGGGGGGAGGAGGEGGAGGGGGGTADSGHPATETVSAGQVTASSKYKMVFTLGQPTQNQGKTTSSQYRLQGGLVGANGSVQ